MKNIIQPSLYFSPYSLKAVKQWPASTKSINQSPYLKAVLSEKRVAGSTATVLSMASSSMAAALRYIARSK